MLQSMRVKNLALVDDISINFKDGLNILTGETGAGKSVLMNSINLCLGGKADKSIISYGKDFALVELTFSYNENNKELEKILSDLDISPLDDNDNTITISRKIGTKSVCRINGETVNTKALQLIGSLLIDAHAQHETSKLLNPSRHIDILDQSFGFNNNHPLKKESIQIYKEWKAKKEELDNAKNQRKSSNREISLAQYEIEEIEEANLEIGEDEKLEETYKLMKNSKKIFSTIQLVLNMISGDGESNLQDSIGYIDKEFSTISNTNEKTNDLYEKIIEIEELTNNLSYELNDFLDDCQFSDEYYYEVETRLNEINSLKNKYGNTIEEILSYYEERKSYVEKMENYEEYLNNLIKEEKELKEKLDNLHSKITKEREKAAIVLSKEVTEAMHGLNFNDSIFRIDIQETNISSNGRDKVEFMAILNKGMQEQPLANVASGGELSRVMLALKSVIALKDNVETLIFDEIDTGISGNTAWLVGERLFATSINRQILCITHLPQIAAFEKHHYVIEKENIDNKATTNIYEIDDIGSNLELERLSGVSNKNAINDLKNKANTIKEKYKNLG